MSHYGALLTITKKKGALNEQDNALLKKVLGILDMDEFVDVAGEPFNLGFEPIDGTDNQYRIKLSEYSNTNEVDFKAAKDNDWEPAKEIKDMLTSTLSDHFGFKVVFEEW
ncbi:hypothetical protein BH09BAC1_BH09BAC1_15440 [soil metagenome]